MPVIPKSIRSFVEQQETLRLDVLREDKPQTRLFPYSEYWRKAVACMLLSGRVKPKVDGMPNMTDAFRICKEANFHPYMFERAAQFLVRAEVVSWNWKRRQYEPGPHVQAFWQFDLAAWESAARQAFVGFVKHPGGSSAKRLPFRDPAILHHFAALFVAAFRGLALREDKFDQVLKQFSQLPQADLTRLGAKIGVDLKDVDLSGFSQWLDAKGQEAFHDALYQCEWAYAANHDNQTWMYLSDNARILLGLQKPPKRPVAVTDFQVQADLVISAGADLPLEKLLPLFRSCRIQKIRPIFEFQLSKKHLSQAPAGTAPAQEVQAALEDLEPLPPPVESFLSGTKSLAGGALKITGCSAIVKPENAKVLAAIRTHQRLKNYLESGAPPGYLLIKSESNPHNFIQRCRELGFKVTG